MNSETLLLAKNEAPLFPHCSCDYIKIRDWCLERSNVSLFVLYPRNVRIIGIFFIVNEANENLNDFYLNNKRKGESKSMNGSPVLEGFIDRHDTAPIPRLRICQPSPSAKAMRVPPYEKMTQLLPHRVTLSFFHFPFLSLLQVDFFFLIGPFLLLSHPSFK